MKNTDKARDYSIDRFYGEDFESIDESIKSSEEYIEYAKKLQSSVEKLDVLNQDIIDFDVNTLAIIEKAHGIKEKRKFRMEMVWFVIVAILILSAYTAIGFIFGFRYLIISQTILLTLLPWLVIPIALRIRKKGDLNG